MDKLTPFEDIMQLLVRLHELNNEGKNDGAEADRIREEMEQFYPKLNTVEIQLLDRISAALYKEKEPCPEQS